MYTLIIDGKTVIHRSTDRNETLFQYLLEKEDATWGMVLDEQAGAKIAEFNVGEKIDAHYDVAEREAQSEAIVMLRKALREELNAVHDLFVEKQNERNSRMREIERAGFESEVIKRYLTQRQWMQTMNDPKERFELAINAVTIELDLKHIEARYDFLVREEELFENYGVKW